MDRCLETLCVRNRHLQNLSGHNERFTRTRQALWPSAPLIRLDDVIQLPDWLRSDLTYKCRVIYGPTIEQIEFEPYTVRPVRSLAFVDGKGLDYRYKYANRQPIHELFTQRGSADDILIVRDGLITDTSYANVALFDGNRWLTPAYPLLEGTQRARLLKEGKLFPADIRATDLPRFQFIKLINAMLDWDQTENIPIQHIH